MALAAAGVAERLPARLDRPARTSTGRASGRKSSISQARTNGPLGLEPGDPVAEQPDGRLVHAVRHQRRHLAAAALREAVQQDRAFRCPGATSMALPRPKVSCCGRAPRRFIFSRGVARASSIFALPPPASTWQTEQLTCRYARARRSRSCAASRGIDEPVEVLRRPSARRW